jgi:hypothetical protein
MKMITVKDAAGMAGVSVITMHRWIKAGWGPPYHLTPTRTYRLAESDVLAWLASLKHESKQLAPDSPAPLPASPAQNAGLYCWRLIEAPMPMS